MSDNYTKEKFEKEFCALCGSQRCSGLNCIESEDCKHVIAFLKNAEVENVDIENFKDERFRLTAYGCLCVVLNDYGIDISNLTPVIGKHLVEDFMDLMCKQGHIMKKDEE